MSTEREYNLELSGPILPSTVYNLTSLLQSTHGPFYINFSNHDTTTPLNCSKDLDKTDDLRHSNHNEWLQQPPTLGKHGLNVLTCKKEEFKWIL